MLTDALQRTLDALGPAQALVWARGCAVAFPDEAREWGELVAWLADPSQPRYGLRPPPADPVRWDPPVVWGVSVQDKEAVFRSLLLFLAKNPGISLYALLDDQGKTARGAVRRAQEAGLLKVTQIKSYGSGQRVGGVVTLTQTGYNAVEELQHDHGTNR